MTLYHDVFTSLYLYLGGQLSRDEVMARLKVKELYNQLVFAPEKALSFIRFQGSEVATLFERHGLFDYVYDGADSLHTTGNDYIVADIDSYIARLNKGRLADGRARTPAAPQSEKGAAA